MGWQHGDARGGDARGGDPRGGDPRGDDPRGDDAPTARFTGTAGIALLLELSACDPATLHAGDAVAYLQATERAIAWAQGLQDDALVAIAGPRVRVDVHDLDSAAVTVEDAARSEIAAAMRWSDGWAHERITAARLLHGPLPETRRALRAGEITRRHADTLCAGVQRLSSYPRWLRHTADLAEARFFRHAMELERSALPGARATTVAATRRRVDRALIRIDAEHVEQRRRQRLGERDVWVQDEGDGIALLMARMGIAEAHACLGAIDAVARELRPTAEAADPAPSTECGDGTSIGERRAQAMARLLLGAAGRTEPTSGPVRAHVDVVVGLDVLLGLADGCGTLTGPGPGGPVPVAAEVIRELVASDTSTTLRRLVTDPVSGHLLDRGRTVYAVPPALRAFLIARDGTCRFPGCSRRAGLGQADHAIPWERGGPTTRSNLGMLCVRHHQLKTLSGWTIEQSGEDGSCRWRSPAGIPYDHPPPRLLSDE